MTVETQVVEEGKQEEVVETVNYDEKIKELETRLAIELEKKEKLLHETKKAKADRLAAEVSAQKAAEEKAQKDGEFEKLWQTAKKDKEELEKRLHDISVNNRKEKLQVAAMRAATELADGDNAELLSEFIIKNLDKLADETGSLGDDVLKAVTEDFKNNKKFQSLLRGSKAVGGGATGNMSGSRVADKVVERSTFDKFDPAKKMKFIKDGGQVIDNKI